MGLSEKVKERAIDSQSAIQSIIVPGNAAARALAQQLQAAGFDIRPILHPTVPKGKERIRICLHAFNSFADIDQLCQLINQYDGVTQ